MLRKLTGILILFLLMSGCATQRRGPLPPVNQKQERSQSQPQKQVKKGDTDLVCDLAQSFIGLDYVWGGSTPKGFDCSGLTQYCYRQVGVKLPRKAVAQSLTGQKVPLSKLEKGDLLFFKIDSRVITHVGMHIGNNRFVHAPGRGKKIKISSLDNRWWKSRLSHARRVI